MNKQKTMYNDVQMDVQTDVAEGLLTPLKNDPVWNSCGKPAAIQNCAIIKHRARQVVTAMHTISNQLRLFSWRVNADGTVVCTGATEGQGHDVVQIDLVRIDPIHAIRYVTVCRTNTGEIYLQCWDVSNTGAIYPSGPVVCGEEPLTWVRLLALGPDQLLTAGLGRDGLWHLCTWQVNQEGSLEQQQDTTMPATNGAFAVTRLSRQATNADSELEFAAGAKQSIVVTVQHIAPDLLRWIVWRVLSNGTLETLYTYEERHTEIIELAVTMVGDKLVTLLHSASGQLQLLTHPLVQMDGSFVVARTNATTPMAQRPLTLATDVRHFALSREREQLLIAYTTCHATTQRVTLLRWPVPPSEQSPSVAGVLEIGSLALEAAHHLAIGDQPLEGNAPVLTAVGTTSGGLQLTTWGVNG